MNKFYMGLLFSLLATFASGQTLLNPVTHPKFQNPIPSPTKINVGSATTTMQMAQTTQWLGLVDANNLPLQTTVWGYGLSTGAVSYPGPTLVANSNSVANIEWQNNLPQNHLMPLDSTYHRAMATNGIPTVVHLHGAHVEAASDGNTEAWYTSGYAQKGPNWTKNVYTYGNTQEGTTLWYHDHALGMTRLNVYAGLAGFYLLNDVNDQTLSLPRGNYDREIVVQDRMFDNTGKLFLPTDPAMTNGGLPEFFGDFIVVNGVVWPFMNVEPRKYRLRLLNGSDSRVYTFGFSNGASFFQIGTDDGKLNNPKAMTQLTMMPGERAEVIVDFSTMNGQTITLLNTGTDAPFGNPASPLADPATTGQIMQFRVNQPLNAAIPDVNLTAATNLRPTLGAIQDIGVATKTRKLGLFEGTDDLGRILPMLGIVDPTSPLDGSLSWHDPVTENVNLNDTEIWEIYNTTADAHPVHLHLVSFQILSKQTFTGTLTDKAQILHNGGIGMGSTLSNIVLTGTPQTFTPAESGWKDTHILMPGEVMRIKAKFDLTGEYVWHCHILSHEDHDMMRRLVVLPNITPCSPDVVQPVMTACPANINLSTANTAAVATWTAPTATDNCSIPSVSFSTSPTTGLTNGGLFPVGTTTVMYMAMDAANNMAMCNFTVTVTNNNPCVNDVAPPVITACPANQSLTTTNNACKAATWTTPTATDNCSTPSVTSTYASGFCFPVGTTTVTYTATDAKNNTATCSFAVTVNNSTCFGGLMGYYYNTNNLSGSPVLQRQENINFDWAANAPATGVNAENFSVRWLGSILAPTTGVVTFKTTTDDGVRLWVNNQLIIDQWVPQNVTAWTGSISLVAGQKYSIKMEYNDLTGLAVAKLFWSYPGIAEAIIPTSNLCPDPCATDAIAPVLSACPVNQNLTTTGTTAVASWTAPTATDNCTTPTVSFSTSPTVGLTNGGAFPVGTTTVSYMAMDAANNMSTCNFTVVVTNSCATDIVKPVLSACPANQALTTTNNACITATWTAPTATDNCGTPSVTSTHASGFCFPVGTTTVTYTANDAKNNTATCSFAVTVANSTCSGGLVGYYYNTNNLSGSPVLQRQENINFDWAANAPATGVNAENFSVRWLGSILAPTTGVVTFKTTTDDGVRLWVNNQLIIDKWVPQNVTAWTGSISLVAGQKYSIKMEYNDLTGSAVAKLFWSYPGIAEAIIPTSNLCPDPCATDAIAPVLSACPVNQNLTTTGTTAVASWTAPTATDNCTTPTVSFSTSPTVGLTNGGAFPVGTTTVSYMAMDAANNMSTCNFTVVVTNSCATDIVKPVLSACPANQTLTTTNNACKAATWTAPTATDNCSTPSVTSSHASGFCFPVGTTTVTYTATDAKNNTATCSFTVTNTNIDPCATDVTKPVLSACPANQTLTTTNNVCKVATWTAPTATDNCGIPSVTSTHASGFCFPVGTTTVTYTATDAKNNTATCSFTVTNTNVDPCATDVTKPVLSACPANQALTTTNNVCKAATWTAPTATDNCSTPSVTSSHASGFCFPVGTTTVTYTATDAKNNTATCSFTVAVSDPCSTDAVKPVLSACPANQALTTTNNACKAATWTAPTATDNCSTPSVTSSHASGFCFPVGTTTVTYTATDAKNNTATCSFTVTVTNTDPCASLSIPTYVFTDTNRLCIAITNLPAGAYSSFIDTTFYLGKTQYCSWVSSGTFNLRIKLNGCIQSIPVTVGKTTTNPCLTDITKPVLSACPANQTLTTTNSVCKAATWAAPTATDNCGTPSVISSHASGFCFPVGTTTVTYTATDAKNNTATCSFTVTVVNSTCSGGLVGTYYNSNDLTGTPVLQRQEVINFDWATNAPAAGVNAENFSVRWLGSILSPITGVVTFKTSTDDGVRLWVNNQLIIDKWVPQNVTAWTGSISLVAGQKYSIKMEYNDLTGYAAAKLLWSYTGIAEQIIPSSNLCSDPCATDVTKPVLSACPTNKSLTTTSNVCKAATWTAPTATDNCGTPSVTSSHASGFCFPVGTTTVTYTARDVAGNTATCSFTVTVNNSATSTTCGGNPDQLIWKGNIDYVAIGGSMSMSEDRSNCGQYASSSKILTIPTGATIKAAYLYWSGSGALDNAVTLNGYSVTAQGYKTYYEPTWGMSFFGARADVSNIVKTARTYSVSNLTWNNTGNYCFTNSAYGAWSMVVVYEQAGLTYSTVHINTDNFRMTYPAGNYSSAINCINVPVGCASNAKMTIIAFEGDAYKGEYLYINGAYQGDNLFSGSSGPNLDIQTFNVASHVYPGTTSLSYNFNAYLSYTVWGNAVEGLFDYVKVLKYNTCSATSNLATASAVLDMQAHAEANRSRIEWVNNYGFETDYFVVEKMNEKSGQFEKMSAHNAFNSDQNEHYLVYDNNPHDGDNIYRIAANRYDGSIRYSESKKVSFNNLLDVRVFPNPADEVLNIDLKAYEGLAVGIQIYNTLGKLIVVKQVDKVTASPIQMPTNEMPVGSYLIRLLPEGKREVTKQVKIAR